MAEHLSLPLVDVSLEDRFGSSKKLEEAVKQSDTRHNDTEHILLETIEEGTVESTKNNNNSDKNDNTSILNSDQTGNALASSLSPCYPSMDFKGSINYV